MSLPQHVLGACSQDAKQEPRRGAVHHLRGIPAVRDASRRCALAADAHHVLTLRYALSIFCASRDFQRRHAVPQPSVVKSHT